jgi:hypothetical protein
MAEVGTNANGQGLGRAEALGCSSDIRWSRDRDLDWELIWTLRAIEVRGMPRGIIWS